MSLIADQRFGKIEECSIDEQTDQITLSFTFALHGLNERPKNGSISYADSKKPVAFGSRLERGLQPEITRSKKRIDSGKTAGYDGRLTRSVRDRSPSPIGNPVDRLFLKELRNNARETEIEQLISEGADPNTIDPESKLSALCLLIENETAGYDLFKRIIKLGAKVNEQYSVTKDTPLHIAVKRKNKAAVRALLETNNLDQTITNNKGDTAYDIAVRSNDKRIVREFSSNLGKSVASGIKKNLKFKNDRRKSRDELDDIMDSLDF